jgi:hypothetical protein
MTRIFSNALFSKKTTDEITRAFYEQQLLATRSTPPAPTLQGGNDFCEADVKRIDRAGT